METGIAIFGVVIAIISVIIAYIQLRRTPKSTKRMDILTNTVGSDQHSQTSGESDEYRGRLNAFVKKLEIEWRVEKVNQPIKLDNGKLIFARALQSLLDFRVLVPDGIAKKLAPILEDAIDKSKTLQEHDVFLDGGVSYRAFWEMGDSIIELLKSSAAIQKVVE